MATSGSDQRREKKPESVQFWLAIAAISLLFHALFIVGVKRWATVAVVEPAGGPIDVEMMDPIGRDVGAEGDPIVPAAAFKPEPFRPEPTPLPEFSPEPSPEVIQKPEPEPIGKEKPVVKEKPIGSPVKPNVPATKPEKPQNSKPVKKPPIDVPQNSGNKPISSGKPLPQGAGGQDLNTNIGKLNLLSTPGEIGGKGTARLRLKFPPKIPFPATFSLKPGDAIRAEVKFTVTGNDFQSPTIEKLSPELSGREREKLMELMYEFLAQVSVESIEIETDAVIKPDTEWKTTIELRL